MTISDRLRRLWAAAPAIGQVALASGLAWFVATDLVGHQRPFVAVISTIVGLGLTYGQRTRRSVEIAAGVAVGVLVADLIILALGTGPFEIGLVVALAMSAAILLGGTRLVVSQAATSAAIVATVAIPDHITLERFVDALVGGGVALSVNLLFFPVDPVRLARRAARPLLDELSGVLRDVAKGLEDGEEEAVEDALARGRGLDALHGRFAEAALAGGEIGRFSPFRRQDRTAIGRYVAAVEPLGLAANGTRGLARSALRAVHVDAHLSDDAPDALRELAAAAAALAPALDDPARAERAREHALRASGQATLVLERTGNINANVVVGRVRSVAVDLLRGLGISEDDAYTAMRRAAADAAAEELGPGVPPQPRSTS